MNNNGVDFEYGVKLEFHKFDCDSLIIIFAASGILK